ncbi:DNA recombination protein RmuC [Thalassotalea maritima]|uniref:DNA recombination protein RmuC n=1 Tax=Thalassotalea maritima TaxID=3242416 RepID=UPI00352945CA
MTTLYISFLLALLLVMVLTYWLATRQNQKNQLALSSVNTELEALKLTKAELEQIQRDLNDRNTALEVQLGKSVSEKQALLVERERLAQELTTSQETLSNEREQRQQAQQREAGLSSKLASVNEVYATVSKELMEKNALLNRSQQDLSDARANVRELEAQLIATTDDKQTTKDELKQTKQTLIELQQSYHQVEQSNARLQTEMKTKQLHFDQQLQLLQDSKDELKKEFERLANDILERKGKAFKDMNTESMQHILQPIHQELQGFKNKVEDIHSKESEQRVKLRTELENLQKLNKEITEQASKLTTALQGQKKVQGNWGELMLENVLDNSGLRLDKDYKREVTFSTEEGRLRPDAVVYLPQNKHLVIDAKTSLSAYTRFVNAEDDAERTLAKKEHAQAVRDRLNELADKDYYKLPGLNSPEVVVMFIPVESAYVEALKADETLFQTALERNILIATPTTLLTSLNIVRQLWRFEEQNKHTAELANRAEKFYAKLNTFLTSMDGVGKQLDKAKDIYDKAYGQLYSGRGNLIKQASEFKELGVAVQSELPAALVEKANLELGADHPQISAALPTAQETEANDEPGYNSVDPKVVNV